MPSILGRVEHPITKALLQNNSKPLKEEGGKTRRWKNERVEKQGGGKPQGWKNARVEKCKGGKTQGWKII